MNVQPEESLATLGALSAALVKENEYVVIGQGLAVVDQTSLMTEDIEGEFGHAIVKNSPFRVFVVLTAGGSLENAEISCSLAYDTPDRRSVISLKNTVLTYKVRTDRYSPGEAMRIDAKIAALSSQHEGHRFVLVITATLAGQVCWVPSEPIRVISKADQVKGNVPAVRPQLPRQVPLPPVVPPVTLAPISPLPTHVAKRPKIEVADLGVGLGQTTPSTMQFLPPLTPMTPLQHSFREQLMRAFEMLAAVPQSELENTVLEALSTLPQSMGAMVSTLTTAMRKASHVMKGGADAPDCNCEKCPYRTKLEQLDSLYVSFC